MSISSGPSIVTNNLSLALDAGDTRSYSGTGSTWYDLSSNKYYASMYGSVPFITDTAPCFNFASATGSSAGTSSLGFSVSSSVTPATGNYTFEVWVKEVNAGVGQMGLISNAGGADGFRFGAGSDGIYFLCGPNYTEGGITWVSAFNNSIWHQCVAVFDRTGVSGSPRVQTYLDGQYQNYGSLPSLQTSQNNSAPGIVRSPCCSLFTGKLALVHIYTSALSADNISQNFNALRGRYEI